MHLLPHRFRVALGLLLVALLFVVPSAHAQGPDGRPYLELPFEGGSAYRVSCGYTCYQHFYSMTYAVDFATPSGIPILAAAAGEVMAVTWEVGMPLDLNLGDALIVYIDHGEGWFTRYVHLDGITVQVGDEVEMGDVIGYSGTTGASSAHLHFELRYGDSLRSPSVPIDELFGGEPLIGSYYESQNYPLSAWQTPPDSPEETVEPVEYLDEPLIELVPTEVAEPLLQAPVEDDFDAPETLGPEPVIENVATVVPDNSVGLVLSQAAESLVAGRPFEASFTVRNNHKQRTTFSLVGVGSRHKLPASGASADGSEWSEAALSFDRAITLNPGKSYEFSQTLTLDAPGKYELFVFLLDESNEWIALDGASTLVSATVLPAAGTSVFLPLVLGQLTTASPEQVAPLPTSAVEASSAAPETVLGTTPTAEPASAAPEPLPEETPTTEAEATPPATTIAPSLATPDVPTQDGQSGR